MTDFIIDFGKTDILILISMLPSIVIGFIIYRRDIVEKEPISLLAKLFVFGVLSSGVALLLEIYVEKLVSFINVSEIISIFLNSFIVIAFCEEITKWFFTYVICWNNKEFNYTYDAICYSAFISLGFATIENILAVLSNGGDLILAIQRGLITVPAHAFFGIISGYYLGLSKKYVNRGWINKKKKVLILSVLMPILMHGLFDSLLFLSDIKKISIIFYIALIGYLYYSSCIKVIKVSKKTKKITKE